MSVSGVSLYFCVQCVCSTLLYPSLCRNDDQDKEPMINTKIIQMGNQQVRMPIYGSVLGGVRLCLKAQAWCDIGHV